MSQIFIAISAFILINGFLLVIFSIPFIAPILIRSYRLKKLAYKYGLSFESRLTKDHAIWSRKETSKKNVISGTYKDKNILIYDILSYKPIPYYTKMAVATLHSANSYSLSQRSTHLFIDGIEQKLKPGMVNGYSSVKGIEKSII